MDAQLDNLDPRIGTQLKILRYDKVSVGCRPGAVLGRGPQCLCI
jgi:hypothetical protein